MSRKTIRAGLLTLVATAATVFAAPTPGMAAEADFYEGCASGSVSCQNGVSVSSAPSSPCGSLTKELSGGVIVTVSRVCVDPSGDYVYVYDGYADGYAALGQVEANSGVDVRLCRNGHGTGTWARCNFDWSEGARKTVSVGVRVSYTNIDVYERFSFTGV